MVLWRISALQRRCPSIIPNVRQYRTKVQQAGGDAGSLRNTHVRLSTKPKSGPGDAILEEQGASASALGPPKLDTTSDHITPEDGQPVPKRTRTRKSSPSEPLKEDASNKHYKATPARPPNSTILDLLSQLNSSTHHSSLPTFLAHATATNLSPTSPVYKGTHYEYTAIASLRRLNFALTRVARRGDNGIDLLGHWSVPSLPTPLRVLAQCKARSGAAASPEQVRELEGSFVGAPAGWRGEGVLGLLIATGKASKGVLAAVGRSKWPVGFVKMSAEGVVEQMVWNRVAEEAGLQGLGVTTKFSSFTKGADGVVRSGDGVAGNGDLKAEVALTWEGGLVGSRLDTEPAGVAKKRGRPPKM